MGRNMIKRLSNFRSFLLLLAAAALFPLAAYPAADTPTATQNKPELPNGGMALGVQLPEGHALTPEQKAAEAKAFQDRKTYLLSYIDKMLPEMARKKECLVAARDQQALAACDNVLGAPIPPGTPAQTPQQKAEAEKMFKTLQTGLLSYTDSTITDTTQKRVCIAQAPDIESIRNCGDVFGTSLSSGVHISVNPGAAAGVSQAPAPLH